MAAVISLEKGNKCVLSKDTHTALIGLGWDVGGNSAYDLDAAAFLLGEDGKMRNAADFVYFSNLAHPTRAVVHSGDNLTGEGDGDDEQIRIDFDKVPADVKTISIVVAIFKAAERHQNFGQVKNAYCRLVDTTGNKEEETHRFDLSEDYSMFYGMHMVDIYRHNGDWKINAVGEGIKGDLNEFLAKFRGNV